MADIWFSSDLHFDHANIISFCDRPFSSTHEMNEAIIERHNAVVKPQDHHYNLGDVTMIRGGAPQVARLKAWVSRLNGHKRLIMGNHDHFSVEAYLTAGFEKIMAMQMFDNIRFTHIPIHPFSMGSAVANVHGHIHNIPSPAPVVQLYKRSPDSDPLVVVKPYINISCEMTDYSPIHLDMIKQRIRLAQEAYGKSEDPQVQTTAEDCP